MSWSIKQNGKNDDDNDAPRTFSHGALCPCMHAQSHLTCNPMDCILPGFSVHGILQARILEWVATPSSRGSSRLRDRTCISCYLLLHWQADPLPLSQLGSPVLCTCRLTKSPNGQEANINIMPALQLRKPSSKALQKCPCYHWVSQPQHY